MRLRLVAGCCGVLLAGGAACAPAQGAESPLVGLARQRFAELTETEERFVAAVAAGRAFDLRSDDAAENDPAKGADWPASRVISLDCIAWLCTAGDARALAAAHGVRIVGARIEGGSLDLASVDVPFGLSLTECYLPQGLDVANSSLRDLTLNRSRLGAALDADGLVVARSLRAVGATIVGDANLRRLHVGDGVDFSEARIAGTVHLPSATIDGDLRLTGASVVAPSGAMALNLDLARVGGTVYLDEESDSASNGAVKETTPFTARGEVRLVLAKIGGNLDCWGGRFDGGGEARADQPADALYANGLQVDGSVFLAHGLTVRGKVSLRTARIEHYLNIYELGDGQGPAFGDAAVDLQACRVGTLNCDTLAWTRPGRLALNGFQYDRIELVKQQGDVETQLPLHEADLLAWLKLPSGEPFFPQTYEQLATVLHREGYENQAREVLIRKEQELGLRAHSWRERLWYRVLGPAIGYGHDPLRGLKWLLAVWLVGAAVFGMAHRRGLLASPAALEAPAAATAGDDSARPWLQPLIYALDVLVPLVDFGQARQWVPDHRRPGGVALQWFHWCLIVVGWTLTTLVVAGITGLVRR